MSVELLLQTPKPVWWARQRALLCLCFRSWQRAVTLARSWGLLVVSPSFWDPRCCCCETHTLSKGGVCIVSALVGGLHEPAAHSSS